MLPLVDVVESWLPLLFPLVVGSGKFKPFGCGVWGDMGMGWLWCGGG